MLKPRQERILRAVIEEFIISGAPVGSRVLSETVEIGVAPSTIRNDLAQLEDDGLLAHPHTSAGRVPTDAGYRYYVESIMRQGRDTFGPPQPIEAERQISEVDEALHETAEALSRVTELLAVVTAPSLAFTSIRHIEVLTLHPHLVMTVIITTSGRVSKRVFRLDQPVDEGLASFARAYLNERLTGARLGTRLIDSAFSEPGLSPVERTFLHVLRPAFEVVGAQDADGMVLEGTSRLLETLSSRGAPHINELVEILEERCDLLELLYDALRQDGVYLRIGHELTMPSLQSCALVAANYGVANRNLGTVSVLGPTRMDYQRVIGAVRASADNLSQLIEEIW